MTEKEKMLSGELYSATDEELLRELNETKDTIHRYNQLMPSETGKRKELLLNLLHLQFNLILLLDGFAACFVVVEVDVAMTTHLHIQHTLLAQHLPIQGEELSSLLRRQGSLGGDELLKVGIKLCRVELRSVLGRHGHRHDHEHQDYQYSFHRLKSV